MGEIKYMGALIMISIFALAITGYAIGYGTDNGAVVSLDPNSELAGIHSKVQNNSNSFYVETNSSQRNFFLSKITGQEQSTVSGEEFKLGLGSMVGTINDVFKSARKSLFGNSPAFGIIFTVFSSFLIYIGIRYIYKTWKGGNPD
jgi:hypothetical protein